MKRSAALTGLSHDHHQALFVAQRLRRAEQVQDAASDFRRFWRDHGGQHFRIEEEVLLPMWATLGSVDLAHVTRIANEHLEIRVLALQLEAGELDPVNLRGLGELLHAHVRYEERELFPLIEDDLGTNALERLAAALDEAEAS